VDEFASWRLKLSKLWNANQDLSVELLVGAELLQAAALNAPREPAKQLRQWAAQFHDRTSPFYNASLALSEEVLYLVRRYETRKFLTFYDKVLFVTVDRPTALFSAWYEVFPRSWAAKPGAHGSFRDCERILPEIARMGFDVLYLPPIHPIGLSKRRGKNNAAGPQIESPGSPWAIGSMDGGHKTIHPKLGNMADFKHLIASAGKYGLEIALDIALQCSPDHPYVKEHPQWFKWRPNGRIQFAENPPKKYEDIYPLDFDTEDWENLWKELRSVFEFWIRAGVRIFRVDNPHTKPFGFWDWLIGGIRSKHRDVIFLSEAFTRPKVMARLAKGGFQQSYTYFTWRNSKWELTEYLNELTQTPLREYFRPNFWPNTPDILVPVLQHGGRAAFLQRLILAATMSSNYGIYGPAFELCINGAVDGKEEYLDSEKYEIKQWDWEAPWNLKDIIAKVNLIRRMNPALQTTRNLRFVPISNDQLIAYSKATLDRANVLLMIVNLDPYHTQSGWTNVPLDDFGLTADEPYDVEDLLSGDRYTWRGAFNYVELNPFNCPAHIFKLRKGRS